jgi:hypothetical protein
MYNWLFHPFQGGCACGRIETRGDTPGYVAGGFQPPLCALCQDCSNQG